MDILIAILLILLILVGVVVYQSRQDKPSYRVYLSRFSHLAVIILSLFKNVGVCLAQKTREINWDLTTTTTSTSTSTSTST